MNITDFISADSLQRFRYWLKMEHLDRFFSEDFLDRLHTLHFQSPQALWLLLALPVVLFLVSRRGPVRAVLYSSVNIVRPFSRRAKANPGGVTLFFRLLALTLLILGLARPRIEVGAREEMSRGIDIMLVLDFSYSMQEGKLVVEGNEVTFMDCLKRITRDFIKERPNDRLGIIGFAVSPYLVSPLTSDHKWVMDTLDDARLDLGTAIGSAMVAGVRELELSERETRIMVVVTDGNNNIGVPPIEAAKLARMKGIRIYPVEITADRSLTPRRIAAHPLYNVAKMARGQFFQATDFSSLSTLYEHVEQLEKSFITEKKKKAYNELYMYFVIPSFVLLALEFFCGQIFWRKLP